MELKICQNCGGVNVYEVYPPVLTIPQYHCTWCGAIGPVKVITESGGTKEENDKIYTG